MADNETDYLIIGAGAVGLAFADTLLDEDPDCHITFVDKHAKPGGHWNDAYSFVALHQPSAFYGVNSMAFPGEQIDTHGPNQGLYALASGTEVSAYFEKVMNLRLLPSGRVAYHRLTEFKGRDADGTARIAGVLSGPEQTIAVRRKLVDATFYQTSVPSTHKRAFSAAEGVRVAAPGELPDLWKTPEKAPRDFVILGGGKTAMDAGVWLLEAGVAPERIHWVRPRDSWLTNRKYVQPGEDFIGATIANQIAHLEACAAASDGDALFAALEAGGYVLRIDPAVKPEMFHFAVISEGEIALLRQITAFRRRAPRRARRRAVHRLHRPRRALHCRSQQRSAVPGRYHRAATGACPAGDLQRRAHRLPRSALCRRCDPQPARAHRSANRPPGDLPLCLHDEPDEPRHLVADPRDRGLAGEVAARPDGADSGADDRGGRPAAVGAERLPRGGDAGHAACHPARHGGQGAPRIGA